MRNLSGGLVRLVPVRSTDAPVPHVSTLRLRGPAYPSRRSPFRGLVLTLVASCLFLAAAMPCQGFSYTVGSYRVDVNVRTTLMQLIPQANVTCRLSGTTIKVSATATGFVAQEKEISTQSGQPVYVVDLVLPDIKKEWQVLDFDEELIVSAFLEQGQEGTPTNEYAINVFLPIKSWPHPTPENIQVSDPDYGVPLQKSTQITTRDAFYCIRMVVDRRVLETPADYLLIWVNTQRPLGPKATRRWLETLRRLELRNAAAAGDLARRLFRIVSPEMAAQNIFVPTTLARLFDLKNRFEATHTLVEEPTTPEPAF